VNVLALDPLLQDHIFVGTDAGVYYTADGGQNWWSLGDGIGNVAVTAMKIHEGTRKLVVGTYGLSAYKIDMDGINVEIPSLWPVSGNIGLNVFPNPFMASLGAGTNIDFTTKKNGRVTVIICDINGKEIQRVMDATLNAGSHTLTWNGSSVSSGSAEEGVYFVNISSVEGKAQQKLLLLR
jgi:hypothetical protein